MADEDLSKLKIEKSMAVTRPARRRKALFLAALILVVALLAGLFATGLLRPAVPVEVASVVQLYPSQAFTLLNASGYVVAQRKAAVASKVTSRLISLSVEEGSRVREGEVIARLENEDALASRDRAEANLNLAQSNLAQAKAELRDASASFDRSRELVSRGFISQAEYDASEARHGRAVAAVASAEAAIKANAAALREAKVLVEYTFIKAPFDGVVLTKNADIGDIVTPLGAAANAKAAVVTMADLGSLQVEADVSESNLGKVKVGQPCEIQLDALPDRRFRGVVHMVVPTADRTKATVMVKVRFVEKDSRILPEMSAKVAFLERQVRPEEEKPLTAIHPSAVRERNGKKTVFVVKEKRVAETPVALGGQVGELIEVLSGVSVGERVVLRPSDRLRDGSRIKVGEK